MTSQDQRLVTLGGRVYTRTGESYWQKELKNIIEGQLDIEVLHRVEGDAWILEIVTRMDGHTVSKECRRITDEEAKRILIRLGEGDALLKYGFVKPHEADIETTEETNEGEKIADDKQMQRVPAEWMAKLTQVRVDLVRLAARKDNDPEQRSVLGDCIKEIEAIEKLLECDKVNPWWRLAIMKAMQRIQRILLSAGERALANKLGEWLEWVSRWPQV